MSKAPRNSGQPRHTRVAWAGFAAGLMIVTLIGLRPLGWISTGTDCHGGKDGKDQELVVATGAEVGAGGIRRRLIKEWNNDPKKNIKARLVEISESTDEQRAEMVAAAQSQVRLRRSSAGRRVDRGVRQERIHRPDPGRDTGRTGVPAQLTGDGKVRKRAVRGALRRRRPTAVRTERRKEPSSATEDRAGSPVVRTKSCYAAQFSDYEGGTINLMEAILSGESTGTGGAEWIMDALKDSGKVLGTLEKWHDVATASNGDLREESSLQAFRSGYVGYMRNWPFATVVWSWTPRCGTTREA